MDAPRFDDVFRAHLRELLTWRRDVRGFRREPLPAGALEVLLESACLAPSVGLSQPWRFVSVDDPCRRAAIQRNFERCNAEALGAQTPTKRKHYARLKLAGLESAPCHLAAFADRGTTTGHGLGRHTMPEMIEYSVVIAIHTLWLSARAHGIGLGWVSILDPDQIAIILDLPRHWIFIGYLCLGYPVGADDVPALERERWETRRGARAFLIQR